jgi:CheY-like chemotaxis protein
MDGYSAARRIKADPALRTIPIIAVTSYALNGEERIASLSVGHVAFWVLLAVIGVGAWRFRTR